MGILERIIPPASPQRFANRVIRRLREAGVEEEIRYDPQSFRLLVGKGYVNLANFYTSYVSAPLLKRGEATKRAISLITSGTGSDREKLSLANVRPRLLPRVWPEAYVELSRLDIEEVRGGTAPEMVMRPVCPGLVWGLVVDDEDRVQVLMSASYEELGAGLDELWPVARDNLYKLSLGQFREVVPGVFASPFEDSHDAARLLLPDLFNDLNLKGPPVASAPRPEALLVADGNDPAAIARLAVISRELAEQPGRSVSPIVVVHDGQSWQPLKLERANPARVEVEMNARIARGRDYSEQSELLERREAKAGRDCFVATPSLVRNEETGESFLWTVWPPNVTDALLPEADVVFIGEVEQARAARWSDVQRVFGDRMKREGDSLPRWRVGAGPSQADLAALETAAADDVWRLLESAPA